MCDAERTYACCSTRPIDPLPKHTPALKTPAAGVSAAAQQLEHARAVMEAEVNAILSVRDRIGETFIHAVERLAGCQGLVVATGIGKAGLVAQRLSAILASTGVPSIYVHPAEAAHGDLGRISARDVVVALSNSGASEEILRLLPSLRRLGICLVAITGDVRSPLAQRADVVLDIGHIDEPGPMGLVPTASSAALQAVCDALAMTLVKHRQLTAEEYAFLHPGGKLRRSAQRTKDVMRSGEANPLVHETATLSEAVVVMTNTPGRPGAANVVDNSGRLVGIFTDGDLRRLAEREMPNFETPVRELMRTEPRSVGPEELVLTAAAVMRESHVDQLPVVDGDGVPVGLLDVQDLLAAPVGLALQSPGPPMRPG
jgi:arabinose-5-phosphate isomerase